MISPARRRGFTLLELVIVVAVLMVVTAIAMPNIITALNAYRLRSSASGIAGLFQKTRMLAVSDDRWYTVAAGTASGGQTYVFADLNTPAPNGVLDLDTEKQLVLYLPRGIAINNAPPADITAADFIPDKGLPSFNARGLPCKAGVGVCQPQLLGTVEASGYVCYLRQDRSLGTPGWAAVTVSPAGRIRVWSWNGSAWD